MSRSTILECSLNNATSVEQNSVWTSTFKQPFTIENGDTVQLKNVFLDSAKSQQNQIVLDQDTDLHLTFGYYDINNDNTDKATITGGGVTADYQPYIAYESHDIQNAINIIRIYFKDDGNESDWNTKYAKFQYIDYHSHLIKYNYQLLTKNAKKQGVEPYLTFFDLDPVVVGVKTGTFKLTNQSDFSRFSYSHYDSVQGQNFFSSLSTGSVNVTVPKGSYTYLNLAKYITDKLDARVPLNGATQLTSGSELLVNTKEKRTFFLEVGKDPNDNTAKDYVYGTSSSVNDLIPYWIGSSQNALTYTDRGVFGWQYIHSPLFDPHGNQIVIDYEGAGNKIYTVSREMGIYFLDLEPKEFWTDTLGFNLDDILVKPVDVDSNLVMIQTDDLLKKTTSNYNSLQSLFPTGARKINFTGQVQTISNDTNMLLANELNQNTEGSGYYLIEISGLKQNYLYNDNLNINVNGIVSKQYNASELIVGFGDSSVGYIHNGAPMTLNSMRIRILDPTTKQPAEDLGINNSLIMEIVKAK